MTSQAKIQAQARYDKEHTQTVLIKLNKKTDSDILAMLESVKNKQGYLKALIRKDLQNKGGILSVDAIKMLVQPVVRQYKVQRMDLFGSYARGEAGIDSDVDLMIDGAEIKTLFEYSEMVRQLESALGKKVDLLMASAIRKDDSRSGKRLWEHIERDKVLLYESVSGTG